MTLALHGNSVSRGIAIGQAHVVWDDQSGVREYKIKKSQVDSELQRLDNAINSAKQQLRNIRAHIPKNTRINITDFIDTYLLMISDDAFSDEPKRIIKEQYCNAEWAVKLNRDALVSIFEEMDDAYLRTRCDDVNHVVNWVLRALLKQTPILHKDLRGPLKGHILLASDLAPGDIVLMQYHGIAAFVTESGGPTSHAAILAKSVRIPAIVGLHGARRYIRNNDLIIVDGVHGTVLIQPDDGILAHYEKRILEEQHYHSSLACLKQKNTQTKDGTPIALMANIELPQDFDTVRNVRAAGVGLYRTEFLYMNRDTLPDEEEHFATYTKVLDKLKGLPLTIRTLDLGADKQVDSGNRVASPVQLNPALGLRAVRLCLKEPNLFQPQLRAIIRASALGPVRLMIPMLSSINEVRQILSMVSKIRQEFDRSGVEYDKDMLIGGMIEVPAAAICADIFAKQLDFLSIGTNDLIQYTMAIDRVNDEVSYLYSPLHPAVLRLIKTVIAAGRKAKIPVSICGEIAGEKRYTRLLLGLGLRELSVHPVNLLEIRKLINESDLAALTECIAHSMQEQDVDVLALLEQLN